MKHLIILSLALFIFACGKNETADNKPAGDNNNTTTTETKPTSTTAGSSAKVIYQITGKMNGAMVMYRKGNNFKSEMKQEVMGQSVENTMYSDGKFVYIIMNMMGQSRAMKMKIDKYTTDGATGTDVDMVNIEKNLEKYKKIGTETVLGKECEIYEISPKVTVSVYDKKFPLKVTSPDMTMTATEFTMDDISDDLFKIPTDVTFQEVDAPNIKPNK